MSMLGGLYDYYDMTIVWIMLDFYIFLDWDMGWCQYEAQNLEVPVVIVTSEATDLGNNLGSKARIYQDIWYMLYGIYGICDMINIYYIQGFICHLSI